MKTKTLSFLFLIFVGISGLVISCRLSPVSNSILVIAVDQLGVSQLSCDSDSTPSAQSGINEFCQDSVRFTHAYTTSPLSAPALTSILTGQYPSENGLRSNIKSSLSNRVTTLPEVAQKKGMATSFFSGGAPILRKLNIQQGFETFDDYFTPTPNHLFRPFSKTRKAFETWLNDYGQPSFFSVIYVPDLAFINTPTQTALGENRNLSYESQLEEFDSNLYSFIQFLKSKKAWDSTTVILVGLNGATPDLRSDELSNLNLFSEKTQVGLLIKPARDSKSSFDPHTFDSNVSLADLGATFAEMLGTTVASKSFPVLSLTKALLSNSDSPDWDRPILTASSWQNQKNPRYAIRWNEFLFLLDDPIQVYNSLTDREEVTPLSVTDPTVQNEWNEIQNLISENHFKLWPGLDRDQILKWKGLSEIWPIDPTFSEATTFARLAHRLYQSSEVSDLYSLELLNQQNWPELERWAQGLELGDLEKVAQRNLKTLSTASFEDPCLSSLEKALANNTNNLKSCEDPTASSLIEWVYSEKNETYDANARESLKRRFLRHYFQSRLDRKVLETNYSLQGVWDLSPTLRKRMLTLEMLLALPEVQKYRQIALKAFQQLRED